jgi:hypothetical protein
MAIFWSINVAAAALHLFVGLLIRAGAVGFFFFLFLFFFETV